jgi:hypothetical protein
MFMVARSSPLAAKGKRFEIVTRPEPRFNHGLNVA